MNLRARHRELGTARHAHFLGHLDAGEKLHEAGFEVFARVHILAVGIRVGSDFRGASEGPGAAEIHIALFQEVGDLEVAQHGDTVVVGVVVVPLVAQGVDEEHDFGEPVVVVDDISMGHACQHRLWYR